MRAINTARLYASGHDLLKKQTAQLYTKLKDAIADKDFLFLGCAKDTLFLEGVFYQAKDTHLQKFLQFFHSLGISHVLLDREITTDDLESFMGLLAGAQQGQGDEVSKALSRERIKRASIGLLDYSVFSTVQTVATQLAQTSEDQTIWRQLIIQPAAAGTFNLSPEKARGLARISEDVEELKKLVQQMDTDMAEKQEGVSIAQRGMVLGNFIQNLGDAMAGVAAGEKSPFAQQVVAVLDSLEPQLKTQILGAIPLDAVREEGSGVIHDILQATPDSQFVSLLVEALKEAGANSRCFHNLFDRAMAKYKEPGLLLTIIRQETGRATQEGAAGDANHWQHLEQLLVQQQENDELNRQYHNQIQALATSIQIEAPTVEEDELSRLMETLTPQSVRPAKAQLIVDLIRHPHTTRAEAFLPPLIENFGENLGYFLAEKQFLSVGNQLRQVFLVLGDHPQEALVRKSMNSLLSAQQVRELLENLLKKCRTYDPKDTSAINAICQLYPEKSGVFLLDVLGKLEKDDSPRARWLLTTLASLGSRINRMLGQRLDGATDSALPLLLVLVAGTRDAHLATAVEQLLDHETHEIRLKVISTIGKLRAERSVRRLAEILTQKSWLKTKKIESLQMAAARALAEISTDEARAALKEVAGRGSGDLKTLCQKLL